METHWWECFLQNKTKRIYIWFDYFSENCKLLKFVNFPKLVKIDIFNEKQKQTYLKVFRTNFDVAFDFYFNFTFSEEWNLLKNEKEKSRKIVFPKLFTSVYFQKGLNPQIVLK